MSTFRPSRAQRRYARDMERRLRALDRADARAKAAGVDPYESWLRDRDPRSSMAPAAAATARRGRRPRRLRRLLIVILAAAIPIGAIAVVGAFGGGTPTRTPAGNAGPPAGVGEADAPIGTPLPAPDTPGVFALIRTQRDSNEPVAWDPCRKIHYETSGIAPPLGQELLAASFARVGEVTGFEFVNDGPTSESPVTNRPPYQPDRYGERWAPVLVAWTTPETIPQLGGNTIAIGGAVAVSSGRNQATYVSGILYLDTPQIRTELSHADEAVRETAMTIKRSIMLHEIGHLLGLDHVDDPTQIMYPIVRQNVTDYAAGDLHGLELLSRGRCAPEL